MFLKVLDVVHLQCPQLLDLLLELWQTGGFGVLEKFGRFEKFGTALEGGFLLASMVPPVLILERPHAVPFIRSQTKNFCLKTVKFRVEQPETHRDPEKKTAGL